MKPLYWIGSSKKDLCKFPEEVKYVMGYGLHLAQEGGKHPAAKSLKGFGGAGGAGGAGVLEVVEDYDGDTYRAVYTVRLQGAIYVLHAFQKKSKKGTATPKQDIDLVRQRLKRAEEEHTAFKRGKGNEH